MLGSGPSSLITILRFVQVLSFHLTAGNPVVTLDKSFDPDTAKSFTFDNSRYAQGLRFTGWHRVTIVHFKHANLVVHLCISSSQCWRKVITTDRLLPSIASFPRADRPSFLEVAVSYPRNRQRQGFWGVKGRVLCVEPSVESKQTNGLKNSGAKQIQSYQKGGVNMFQPRQSLV